MDAAGDAETLRRLIDEEIDRWTLDHKRGRAAGVAAVVPPADIGPAKRAANPAAGGRNRGTQYLIRLAR
jgi:hypothetical protein